MTKTEKVKKMLKSAKEQFLENDKIAYISLWGDSNRQRNHAGVWIEKQGDSYTGTLQGRLLGRNVSHFIPHKVGDSLESLVDRILIIWESYES